MDKTPERWRSRGVGGKWFDGKWKVALISGKKRSVLWLMKSQVRC